MVRADAPDDVQAKAGEMLDDLDNYPILDEGHCSDLEISEVCEFWESLSVRERAEYLRESRCGASMFAARRSALPRDDNGALYERLRG